MRTFARVLWMLGHVALAVYCFVTADSSIRYGGAALNAIAAVLVLASIIATEMEETP